MPDPETSSPSRATGAKGPAQGPAATGSTYDNLVVSGLAVALTVLVLEIGARLVYEESWMHQLTEAQALSEKSDYRQNALGLRDVDYGEPPPAGHRRLLLLGDSFTFGLGVQDDAAIFPERLEVALNADLPSADVRRVDVLNGGIPGSLTQHWLRLWRKVAPRFEPDVALVVFFLRDGTRTHSIPDFFGDIHTEVTERNRASAWYRHSYLYRRVRDNLDRRDVGERYTRTFQRAYLGEEDETEEWRAAQRNLRQLRALALERGTSVGFVIFPVLVGLEGDYPFEAICALLEDWARAEGFPVLNLLETFRGKRDAELWVSSWDQHPNALGHRLAAEALVPFAAELLAEHERGRGGGGDGG